MTQSNESKTENGSQRKRMHKKSRGGCITCKIRRKKCDEMRPSCQRCTSTGRKCDGYLSMKIDNLDFSSTGSNLLKSGPSPVYLGYKALLDHFRQAVIPQFAAYYNSTLWQVILAQTSVSMEDLPYAAVALGAAHYEHENYGYNPKGNRLSTLQVYINALSKSREALSRLPREHAVWTGFTLSYILAAVEILCDNPYSASVHLANGLKIAFSMKQDAIYSPPIMRSDCPLIEETICLIRRLKVKLSGVLDDHNKSPRHESIDKNARRGLKTAYAGLIVCVNHILKLLDETDIPSDRFHLLLNKLEDWDTHLARLVIAPADNVLHAFQMMKISREAAFLLLLGKSYFNNSMAVKQYNDNCLLELTAYLSKLLMLESHIKSARDFMTHLTPAQLKLLAIRHGLIPTNVSSCSFDMVPKLAVPNAVERLVMLDENAVKNSGLVPVEALCMDVTSALERGLVSIRYCLKDDKDAFVWVERRVRIWKPAVFRNVEG